MYEQIALSEWGISPIEIESSWTDEYYNMLLGHYVKRLMRQNEDHDEEEEDDKPVIPENVVLSSMGISGVQPYPNVIRD